MSIKSLRIYQDFHRLQEAYRAHLRGLHPDPHAVLKLLLRLERGAERMERHARFIRRFASKDAQQITPFFDQYLQSVQALHQKNREWCSLYLDLCWPADQQRKKVKKKTKDFRERIHGLAQGCWKDLQEKYQAKKLSDLEQKIIELKRELEEEEKNSPRWRLLYRDLIQHVYQRMEAVLVEHRHTLQHLFRKKMLGASERVRDYVHGYSPYLGGEESGHVKQVDQKFVPLLRTMERKRRMFFGLKMLTWGMAVTIFITGLNSTDLDNRFIETVHLQIQRLLMQDQASKTLRAKREYFKNRVLDLAAYVDEDRIRKNLDHYFEEELYSKKEGALYFAQNILQEFFLGISEQKITPQLQTEVVYAASLFDERIAQSIDVIASLYSKNRIRESALKRQILDIRHFFMDYYVFPFIFLSVYDEVPYMFLVAEEVYHQYVYAVDGMQNMEMDPNFYEQYIDLPIKASVVAGDKYPFKDRAGYFDGEFSIVFSSLAPVVEWTAQHEIGHFVEHIRSKYENIERHENTEVNAMLFPLIYSEDKQSYIDNRFMRQLREPKIHDIYTQAMKGILNGFLIYLEGNHPDLKNKLITNRFERSRISYIRNLLELQTNGRIRKISQELYRNPEEYLHTADAGHYITLMTDTGEVIVGAHKMTQRGFMLQNQWDGSLARRGPRFILDQGGDGELDSGFDMITVIKRILRLAIFGEKEFRFYSRAENIAAAVVFFLFFEASCIFMHILGTRIRRRKYLGVTPSEIIEEIYTNHPWSEGKSYGEELNERLLLRRVFTARGNIDDQLRKDIASFKAVADNKKRLLFDVCLCLATFSPKKSYIYKKSHDLIFYIPFIGPYIARSRRLFKRQAEFNDREDYNQKIQDLMKRIPPESLPDEVLKHFHNDVISYVVDETSQRTEDEQVNFDKLDALVQAELIKAERKVRFNDKWMTDPLNNFQEAGTEFDQLDRYRPGDDIRRIDWNVTARSSKSEAYIRKYINQHKIKVAFLMDMRYLDDEEARAKWAADFLRSLNILDDEKILEHLVFVYKDGEVATHRVHLVPGLMNFRMASKIWETTKGLWVQTQYRASHLQIGGLYFYTREENEKLAQQLALTDFQGAAQPVRLTELSLKKMNVFVIGDTAKTRAEFKYLVGDDSQFTFWEELTNTAS